MTDFRKELAGIRVRKIISRKKRERMKSNGCRGR